MTKLRKLLPIEYKIVYFIIWNFPNTSAEYDWLKYRFGIICDPFTKIMYAEDDYSMDKFISWYWPDIPNEDLKNHMHVGSEEYWKIFLTKYPIVNEEFL